MYAILEEKHLRYMAAHTQTHTHAYMLDNADSLVWGSLMLAPII